MLRFLQRWMQYLLPLLVLAGTSELYRAQPSFLKIAQLKLFDLYQQRFPRPYQPVNVRIVDIDDDSLAKFGQWPWPRVRVADMVMKLANAGAKVIAFDIVFAEPDRTSPKNVASIWASLQDIEGLKPQLEQLADHDAVLSDIIEQTNNVVTGYTLTDEKGGRRPKPKWGMVFNGDEPSSFVTQYAGAQVNMADFEKVAAGNGNFSFKPETDGIVRRVPLLTAWGSDLYPSLWAEALRISQRNAQGKAPSTYIVRASGSSASWSFGEHTGVERVRIGRIDVPTDEQSRVWIHFTREAPERTIPAWQVLEETVDPKRLEDCIVFIGTSAAGLKDLRATPLNPAAAGVELHASATEQVLLGHYLSRPDYAFGLEYMLMMALGLALVVLLPRIGALWCAMLAFGSIGSAVAGSTYLFAQHQLLFDPIMPGIVVLAVYLSSSLLAYLRTESEKRQVRGAFAQYLSPELVEQLAQHPELLKLGGETKNMTVLFCDVRGFTTISEQFKSNPQGLTVLMNRFLTPLSDVILARKGCIDKYMGDAIMAFWNAPVAVPDHADKGCESALVMFEEIKKLNVVLKQEAEAEQKPFYALNIGIGLNSGDVVVGNMGSTKKYGYTVMGDAVNLASRLEGQSKTYHVGVVIGEETQKQAADYATIELDLIAVKGKKEAVRIFTILGNKTVQDSVGYKALLPVHDAMLAAYRRQQWDEASALIGEGKRLARLHEFELGEFYDLYVERIAEYRANPPPADWDGVYVATSK